MILPSILLQTKNENNKMKMPLVVVCQIRLLAFVVKVERKIVAVMQLKLRNQYTGIPSSSSLEHAFVRLTPLYWSVDGYRHN